MSKKKSKVNVHYVDDARARTGNTAAIILNARKAQGFIGARVDDKCKWTMFVVEPGSDADVLLEQIACGSKKEVDR